MPEPVPKVEPELRAPPPRATAAWLSAGPHEELLRKGIAATAWHLELRRWVTSGAESGPEIRCRYAFRDRNGKPVLGRYSGSFDGYHLYAGSPDFGAWLDRAFMPGGSFTVLYPPARPESHVIYGTMELFARRTLDQIARAAASCSGTTERSHLKRQTEELMTKTASIVGREDESRRTAFCRMLAETARQEELEGQDLIEPAAERILAGAPDPGLLHELSEFCAARVPGAWAAR